MRKLYAFLFTAAFVFSATVVNSQVSLYTFSQASTAYTPIAGGTLLGNTTTDDQQFVDPAVPLGSTTVFTGPGFPIGFTFTYNGIAFDRIGIENNGWICFGQSALIPSVDINTTSQYQCLSSTATNTPAILRNRFAGIGRDLQAQAGSSLRIETIGAAPNRRCVIQWAGYKRFGTTGTGDIINFQIVLNETTNIIESIYGPITWGATASTDAHVGLGGTIPTDFNNRTTTTNWNTTTAGATNAATLNMGVLIIPPVSGTIFRWTPPPPCAGVPSPGLISGPAGTLCPGATANLSVSGYTNAPGITFQWNRATVSGGPYTPIPGATSNTYSYNTTGGTAYFTVTVTCSFSGLSANTTQFTVTVSNLAHSNVIATPTSGCAPVTTTITGTVSGGNIAAGVGVVGNSGPIALAIPDNVPAGVNSVITLPAMNIATAADLKVRLNLRHSWSGDVRVSLTSPCGVTILFDRLGVPATSTVGNLDNFGTNNTATTPPAIYTLDVTAGTVLPELAGATGFIAAGPYRPSDPNGVAHNWAGLTFPCAAGGNWTLNISDNAGIDVGVLEDWAILAPTTGNYTHSLTGPGTIVQNPSTGANNANGSFTVSNLAAGTHNFTFTSTDMSGCSVSTPVVVTSNVVPAVTIIPGGAVTTFSYTGPAVTIPDNTPAGVNIVLPVAGLTGNITDINFRYDANPAGTCNATIGNVNAAVDHTFIGDLIFRLTSPAATNVIVQNRRGVTMENICTATLDDDGGFPALTTLPGTTGNFMSGNYAPDNALSAFDGQNGNGNWTLNVSDNAGVDIGSVRRFSLVISTASPTTICAGQILQLTSNVVPAGNVVFSPITDLYTDALATIPYTGTPTTTVWAKPTVTRTYTATATTAAGCSGSSTITITVNQLPAITVQPASLPAPVCPGLNVTYSTVATGAGLTYQWQISTDGGTTYTNLTNTPPYSGVTTQTLNITGVTSGLNNVRYRVIVSGTCAPAVTSNPVTLVVASAPTVTTHPANVTICANANATFSVVAAGTPAPTSYQWQVSTDGGGTYSNIGGATGTSYTVTAATVAMSGNRYRVVITNVCGQTVTSNAAILTVNPGPSVTVTSLASTRICLSDTLVPLQGSPSGGSWSGIGVSGFNFIPGVTAVGTYTLTYTYTNLFGCTASATTIARVEDCPERARLLSNDGVLLYPNPNSGQFFIRMNSTLYNYVGLKVYNMAGQLVNGNVTNDAVNSPVYNGLVYGRVIPVNLGNLPSGLYMVKVYYDDGVRTSEKAFSVVVNR